MILGVIVVARPDDTIYAFAIVLGIWLFVSGLVRIVMAIADNKNTGGTRFLMAFLGLLSVLVGLFFVRHTFETIGTLGFLIGIFWVIGGLIEFFSAYGDKGSPGRAWQLIMGVLGFAAGIVTLAYPHLTRAHPGHHHGHLADPLRAHAGAAVAPDTEARRLTPSAAPSARDPEAMDGEDAIHLGSGQRRPAQ